MGLHLVIYNYCMHWVLVAAPTLCLYRLLQPMHSWVWDYNTVLLIKPSFLRMGNIVQLVVSCATWWKLESWEFKPRWDNIKEILFSVDMRSVIIWVYLIMYIFFLHRMSLTKDSFYLTIRKCHIADIRNGEDNKNKQYAKTNTISSSNLICIQGPISCWHFDIDISKISIF